MNIQQIRQLTRWARDAGLSGLELKRPGFALAFTLSRAAPVSRAPAGPLLTTVQAQGPGVFLAAHPAEGTPLVAVGDAVQAGQVLGLLRVGLLLLPVRSPCAGHVRRVRVTGDEQVDYGHPLFDLEE